MANDIKITVNTAEVERDIKFLMRDQYPYALKKTLDRVAERARFEVQKQTRKEFNLHSEFVPKGVWWQVAKKADIVRTRVGTSAVFTAPRISGFMPIHEVGGVRTPEKSRNIAVPAMGLKQYKYRTARGRVKQTYKPKRLLVKWNEADRDLERDRSNSPDANLDKARVSGRGKRNAFLVMGKGGVPLLVRRKTRKRYPLEVLYNFARSAHYEERWRFEPTIRDYVNRKFDKEFKRQMKLAIR